MKTKILLMILVFGFWMGCYQVQAAPITIKITGEITSASGSALPSTIHAGDTFTGTYTYDSSTPDSDPSDIYGAYQYDSPYGISISIGGYEFMTATDHVGQFTIGIANDNPFNGTSQPWDSYSVRSEGQNISIPSLDSPIDYIRWYLRDYDHTAFSSDALPVTTPELADWEYNYFEIHGWDSTNSIWIKGTVTHVTPEPVTGILMAMGVFLMRRKQ
jgi:hypothetical protein